MRTISAAPDAVNDPAAVFTNSVDGLPMATILDNETDTLYFRLDESRIVVDIEFLGVSARTSREELSSPQFQTA